MSSDRVFIIAECGSSWRFGDESTHLANAYRMIAAAKECGADACKFQWTSDGDAMAKRRGVYTNPEEGLTNGYVTYLQYPSGWLKLFAGVCETAGIEFMCTVFLPQDVSVIAPLVKRFKVAAKESGDTELKAEIERCSPGDREVIVSNGYEWRGATTLHCVSKYPCPIDEIKLDRIQYQDGGWWNADGLSDHTGHTLTGAVAVGAGAKVCEVHFRLDETPESNCDFPHSHTPSSLKIYIDNIRTATRML